MKAATKIKGGIASKGEVVVQDGAILVTLDAGPGQEGYGVARIADGVASKGEVVVVDGALTVTLS